MLGDYVMYLSGGLALLVGLALTVFLILVDRGREAGEPFRIRVPGHEFELPVPYPVGAALIVTVIGCFLIAAPTVYAPPTGQLGPEDVPNLPLAEATENSSGNRPDGKWEMTDGTSSAVIFRKEPFEDSDISEYVARPNTLCAGNAYEICYQSGPDVGIIVYGPDLPGGVRTSPIDRGDCIVTARYCYMILERKTAIGKAEGTFHALTKN